MSQVQETVRFPLDIPGYSVVRELGQGGMSRVYLARAERLGGAVALKILDVERAGGLDARQRFHREVETVQRIRHPHVVRILDVGTVQGDPYIAMEYLPLGLKEWIQGIQKGRSGQAAQALIITAMLAEALFCAHQKGIIHRDVKPENILFRETGEPVLCDFGIAKVMEGAHHLTRTGVLIGTPLYMSPEQVRGGKVDTRSDLYSLGVVLYEMLVGHPPYRAEDQIAVALQHVQAPLPELPDELLHLQPLMRCALAKDPDRRWSDGREMANALRAAAADYPDVPGETVILSAGSLYVLPEHAADHKKSRFAQRWNGRWGLWLAGMLALGILVSGLLAAWGRYRENRSWDLAQSAQTPAAVLAYLNRYPDGKWALEAQTWMNRWRTDQGESAREGAEAQPVGQEKNDRGEAEHPSEEIKAGQKPPVLPPSGAGRSVKKREEPMPQGGLSERALSLPEVRRLIDHTRISLEAWRVQRTPLGAQVEDQARRIAWLFPFRKDVSLSRERVERRLYLMNRRAPRRTRWRLPTVGEALRLSAYVRLQKDWGAVGMVWTADQQGGGRSWVVDLDKGAVFGQEHGKTYRFRPVRSLP